MKPSLQKKALALNLESPLFVEVKEIALGTNDLEFNAGYNMHELVQLGQEKVVGVYELVGLRKLSGVETVTFVDLKK